MLQSRRGSLADGAAGRGVHVSPGASAELVKYGLGTVDLIAIGRGSSSSLDDDLRISTTGATSR